MRWTTSCAIVAMILATAAATVAGAQTTRPTTQRLLLARDTTVVQGPLRPDGTIDYVAALNALCGAGVTRDNNFAVPFLELIDAGGGINAGAIARERAALGIQAAPQPLILLRTFAEKNWKQGDGPEWNEIEEKFDELTKTPWKAEQLPLAARWIEAMRDPLDRIVDGSARKRFYIPRVCERVPATVIKIEYPHLGPMRQVATALRGRALLRLGSGDFNGYRSDILAILRIGRLASQAPTLLEKLVAIGCEAVALDSIRATAAGQTLSADQCEQLAADLAALPRSARLGECFEQGERFMMLDYLVMCAVHGPIQAGRMMSGDAANLHPVDTSAKDWNAALRKTNGWYDRMVESGTKPTYAQRAAAWGAIDTDLDKLHDKWSGLFAPFAPIEDRMTTIMLPSVGRAYQAETRLEVGRDLTLLALALRACRAREGHYPQKLEDLTPRYVKTLPADRFTQRPLIYRLDGAAFVLYSVGPNGHDDQGESQGRADDIAVRGGGIAQPNPQ